MFSKPPAMTHSLSPARMAWSARATAFNPDPQTLLTVIALTEEGTPPKMEACRAGFCCRPAWQTLPMITSSTLAGSRSTRSRTALMHTAPSWGARTGASPPWNLPIGVLTAAQITDRLLIFCLLFSRPIRAGR